MQADSRDSSRAGGDSLLDERGPPCRLLVEELRADLLLLPSSTVTVGADWAGRAEVRKLSTGTWDYHNIEFQVRSSIF